MIEKINLFAFLGIFFIILGAVLLLIPFFLKLGLKLEEIHPIILIGKRFDGVYVGTSPIVIIVLVALYLIIALLKR